jgi:D-sedoheptulose 7-phosphate isomerase
MFRHVIVDRDGVLNEEAADGGYVLSPSEWRWIAGAPEALARLTRAGLRVSVVSNQSAVGRGLMAEGQLSAVHARMQAEAAAAGGRIDAVFVCPHAPDAGCDCRKPAPGLVLEALRHSALPASETVLVGDDLRDLEAAAAAGIAAVLVRTGKGRATEAKIGARAGAVFDNLGDFASWAADGTVASVAQRQIIGRNFADHARVLQQAAASLPEVLDRVVTVLNDCLARGNKIMACGNGGSAADAQHLVAELVGRFRDERRALSALTLHGDASTITALANDYGYQRVFARQVEALARAGDVLIAISTSGNSPSVVDAAQAARSRGCAVVALTGAGGGRLAAQCDVLVEAPSNVVARIQEVHGLCIHAVVDALDSLVGRDAL